MPEPVDREGLPADLQTRHDQATLDTALARIGAVVAALDTSDSLAGIDPQDGLTLRVLKVGEEFGETAQALIGAVGQNPRKGVTHTYADVRAELYDVALTALVAAASLSDGWAGEFGEHVYAKTSRVVEAVGRGPTDDDERKAR